MPPIIAAIIGVVAKSRMTVSVILAAWVTFGCSGRSDEAAHQLIEDYMAMSTTVKTGPEVRRVLDELQSRAESLKGELREDFYARYHRLIEMSRLSFETKLDNNGRQQLTDYIQSITGAPPARGDGRLEATVQSLTGAPPKIDLDFTISAAFACGEEALRLEMLLDRETDREKARKTLADKIRLRRGR